MSEEENVQDPVPVPVPVPEELSKVMNDFVRDLITTFPEYENFINKWWTKKEEFNYIEEETERNLAYAKSQEKTMQFLFEHCQKKFPPRFFDILYQNEEMFEPESDIDTEFLPRLHFKNLWQCDITDKTRETMWKYLQLITFSIIGTIDNKEAFGDTAKLFEAINADEFKSKLEETITHIQGLFENRHKTTETGSESKGNPFDFDFDFNKSDGDSDGLNMGDIPDPSELHDHLSEMMDGKIGQLAREIAEETATNLNMDIENTSDMKDVFEKLMKNPGKLMGLVKNVGNKIDTKLKSGDIKESELIAEATEIMGKMKKMPGMGNIQSMLSKMGMGNFAKGAGAGGGGGKMNMSAMEANLQRHMKMAQTRERCKSKAEANLAAKMKVNEIQQNNLNAASTASAVSEEELLKLFSSTEKAERTPRGANPNNNNNNNNNNKNTGKKKKGKK